MPTSEALHKYESTIQELEAILFARHERFYDLKDAIVKNVKQLHYKPTCEFEKKVQSFASS